MSRRLKPSAHKNCRENLFAFSGQLFFAEEKILLFKPQLLIESRYLKGRFNRRRRRPKEKK